MFNWWHTAASPKSAHRNAFGAAEYAHVEWLYLRPQYGVVFQCEVVVADSRWFTFAAGTRTLIRR